MGNHVTDNAFLVAKYIHDLDRMEPQNVGIILWSGGKVATRFADVDSLPSGADDENFARWVAFWERLAGDERIQIGSRPAVTKKTKRFLRELQLTQRGNYLLEQGGEILDGIDNIEQAADFLFARLVAGGAVQFESRVTRDTLKDVCDAALNKVGLIENERFASNVTVPFSYGNLSKSLHFHYAISDNGHPQTLFLRVHVDKEASLTSAVGKFASATRKLYYPRERLVSLYVDDEAEEHRDSVVFLNEWSRSVNVASLDAVKSLASSFIA